MIGYFFKEEQRMKVIQKLYGYVFCYFFLSLFSEAISKIIQVKYFIVLFCSALIVLSLFQIQGSPDSESPFAFSMKSRFQ